MEFLEKRKQQNQLVVKSNDLLQKTRFNLSAREQKILLYVISKIKPEDTNFSIMKFDINEFREVTEIDSRNGKTLNDLKEILQNLSDKSFWVKLENGSELLVRWIANVLIEPNSSVVKLGISQMMQPYLLELRRNFTTYELHHVLHMKSKYAIRLYEILKSYESLGSASFYIADLQAKLNTNYEKWYDVKRKIIEPAMKEINGFTDIMVEYVLTKKGKAVTKITFLIEPVTEIVEQIEVRKNRYEKAEKHT